VNAAQPANRN